MTDSVRLKRDYKDIFLPSLLLIIATAAVMCGFYAIKAVNGSLVCASVDVAGEETNPCIGRLICWLSYFALSVGLIITADRIWKHDQSKMIRSWIPAVLGGTLLWTSIGECSWHFGLNVLSDEGEQIFASFPRIESIQGIPFFPIARALGAKTELTTFYKISAIVNAIIIAAVSVPLILGRTKRTTKYLASIGIYVALGNILFGIVMGET